MRRPVRLAAAFLLVALVGSAPLTLARYGDAGATAASFATGTLLPPTSLTATGGAGVSLAWTPSTSSAATGYRVLRSTTPGSGHVEVSTVTPVGASAGADSPGDGTWYYVLRTFLGSWSSSSSNEASVTLGSVLTGYHACASGVADTGGDGNGYETGAASGCITDGAYASDASSGTNTVNSCADSGKDRHRFWGFALGLPAGVTSIDGIGLRLVAGMNNGAGASQICAELSWDGGASWTAPKAVTLTTSALTAYDLGSITDTWGRAWTAPELGTSTFRLRLIDASTRANKTFRLDGLSVEVAYTP